MVFPDPTADPGPERRKRAARLLFRLIEAGGRLAKTAREADPEAYRNWRKNREDRYTDAGWNWPPSQEVATQTRIELIDLAWPTPEAMV